MTYFSGFMFTCRSAFTFLFEVVYILTCKKHCRCTLIFETIFNVGISIVRFGRKILVFVSMNYNERCTCLLGNQLVCYQFDH